MGEISRLDEDLVFPNPNPDDMEPGLYKFLRLLVGELNKVVGSETNTTVNLLLDQNGDTDAIYIGGIPDKDGIYPDGTWRIKVDDNEKLSFDHKVSGSWSVRNRTT